MEKIRLNVGVLLGTLFIMGYIVYIVPGIDLSVPSHADLYGYNILGDDIQFSNLYLAPRPLMVLILKLTGELPFNQMMWMLSFLGVASFFSPLIIYSKIVEKNIQASSLILFVALIVSHVGIFFGLTHDIGSRLALIFASLTIYYYVEFLRKTEFFYLFLVFVFSLLGFFSKETFVPCIILIAIYVSYFYNFRFKYTITGLFIIAVALVISLAHSKFVGSPFTSGQSAYTISFSIVDITLRELHYLKYALTPQILLGFIFIYFTLIGKRNWKEIKVITVVIFISLVSLLPNAMLSQHGGSPYEIILVPLLSSIIVIYIDDLKFFINYKKLMLCTIVMIVISGVIWGEYQLKKMYWWEMNVARFNQNVLGSLSIYQEEIRNSDGVLVLGFQHDYMVPPWTPFVSTKFLKDNFGLLATNFSIVSPGMASAFAGKNEASRVYLSSFDGVKKDNLNLVMVFGSDGHVWKIIRERDDIYRLLGLKNLDMTRLYDTQYWVNNIENKYEPK